MADWTAVWLPRLNALLRDRRAAVAISLLLVLFLAQALARLTWTLLPPPPADPAALALFAGPGEGGVAARPAQVSARAIAQLHLFGEARKAAPKTQAVVEAPDTRLNLKLRGVVASHDPAYARAIVADGKGVEDAFAVGATLPGNAVLKEIYADRIILEYRGQLETLRLPQESETASAASNRRASGRGRGAPVAMATGDTGALLHQYREALIKDPQSVLSLVRAEPVRDKNTGRLRGYRLRPGKDRALLGRFGLRSGDVVTAVNGMPMDNPLKALELMRDIGNISQIQLEVERNGSPQSFSFQIE